MRFQTELRSHGEALRGEAVDVEVGSVEAGEGAGKLALPARVEDDRKGDLAAGPQREGVDHLVAPVQPGAGVTEDECVEVAGHVSAGQREIEHELVDDRDLAHELPGDDARLVQGPDLELGTEPVALLLRLPAPALRFRGAGDRQDGQ
jgi:hypothetical protein